MKSITVHPNKVNLAEVDIEDWLYANPEAIVLWGNTHVDKWIGRQFEVPSGRIDLLGLIDGIPIVLEVKNVEIDSSALTQVSRYAFDIDMSSGSLFQSKKVVVGKGPISSKVQAEAEALGIWLMTFDLFFSVKVGDWHWTHEYRMKRQERYDEIGALPIWEGLKRTPNEEEEESQETEPETAPEPEQIEIPEAFKDYLEGQGNED